jgi:hypothetical protein
LVEPVDFDFRVICLVVVCLEEGYELPLDRFAVRRDDHQIVIGVKTPATDTQEDRSKNVSHDNLFIVTVGLCGTPPLARVVSTI